MAPVLPDKPLAQYSTEMAFKKKKKKVFHENDTQQCYKWKKINDTHVYLIKQFLQMSSYESRLHMQSSKNNYKFLAAKTMNV